MAFLPRLILPPTYAHAMEQMTSPDAPLCPASTTTLMEDWDDLANALREHIVKEVRVVITGNFANDYPCLARPELEEGCPLQHLHDTRYLSFQFEEAPSDDEADMYALELLPDYRTPTGEFILRLSDVDREGHISTYNTIYATEKVEVQKYDNGNVDVLISTYQSNNKGGRNGLVG